ncbi:hypothetical protein [Pseudanabaena sp. FACHB-2040]|uniref:hypothetical protein n=1 Tax=Pseudanabaena sp. FACHB-2040 TaxID=2692859 RepID=UPI001682AB93|nr:hypothetical protein [Pseudanabaena sp. FACHB-2040]MBD0268929.1 hypothetical protein [Cyanobacteria bacterium Co-bin8]MBD2259986.1 hypothetical protein [Pseudanabaena sp. FACHB-2040]
MRFKGLFIGVLAGAFWLLCGLTQPAFALTPIDISDLSYKVCPAEYGGMVTAGSVQEARCYLIVGKAINRSGKPVTNVDIFGRIYDANDNPVMQNRTRLGSIGDLSPGESDFELRVSVAANQPEPLKLKQFKASGFSGQVRR